MQPDEGVNEIGLGPTQAINPGEAAGTVIGRYHLLQKIGEGGMGPHHPSTLVSMGNLAMDYYDQIQAWRRIGE